VTLNGLNPTIEHAFEQLAFDVGRIFPLGSSTMARKCRRVLAALVAAILSAAALTSCGRNSSELTIHEKVEKVAGTTYTSSEIARQLEVADALCRFDRRVLREIWIQLSPQQMEMQDLLVAERCPERVDYLGRIRPLTGTVDPELTTTQSPPTSQLTTTRRGLGRGTKPPATTERAPASTVTTTPGQPPRS